MVGADYIISYVSCDTQVTGACWPYAMNGRIPPEDVSSSLSERFIIHRTELVPPGKQGRGPKRDF